MGIIPNFGVFLPNMIPNKEKTRLRRRVFFFQGLVLFFRGRGRVACRRRHDPGDDAGLGGRCRRRAARGRRFGLGGVEDDYFFGLGIFGYRRLNCFHIQFYSVGEEVLAFALNGVISPVVVIKNAVYFHSFFSNRKFADTESYHIFFCDVKRPEPPRRPDSVFHGPAARGRRRMPRKCPLTKLKGSGILFLGKISLTKGEL